MKAVLALLLSALGSASAYDAVLQAPCLCIFDIDRTLTGKQSVGSPQCPKNTVQQGVPDDGYSGGTLTLSALTQNISETFCSACYLGAISAGIASGSGSKERTDLYNKLSAALESLVSSLGRGSPGRSVLQEQLGVGVATLPTSKWSGPDPVTSPLVVGCPDATKQKVVPGIIAWYLKNTGVSIADSNVHFFDDRVINIQPFEGLPYNARQVSCATRDQGGAVGLCGATVSEVVADNGVETCGGATAATPARNRVSEDQDVIV